MPLLPHLYDFARLKKQLKQVETNESWVINPVRLNLLKQALAVIDQRLNQAFYDGKDIGLLITGRAAALDQLLTLIWQQLFPATSQLALLAIGGYGRGELHPKSDLDLLLLGEEEHLAEYSQAINCFITLLWDLNLNPGFSQRTPKQTLAASKDDLHLATSLIEKRLICGEAALNKQLSASLTAANFWPSANYFRAKQAEQEARHLKHNSTDHNLEPNVKSSPGGLRDLQLLGWVAKQHFGVTSFTALQEVGFLTASDLELLNQGQAYLWQVRYALHLLTGKAEERLLFNYQQDLAKLFGYEESSANKSVEKLMKNYFRVVTRINELCQLLMQQLAEVIFPATETKVRRLNSRFKLVNGYLQTNNSQVFVEQPSALIEVFALLAQQPEIKGVGVSTIRQLRDNRHLVDENLRNDSQAKEFFLQVLTSSNQVALQLERMSRYGILGRFIPEFGQAVGLTQQDLFHIYTVETHTLKLLTFLQNLTSQAAQEAYPLTASLWPQITNPLPLWLAGLFHDLGKGLGGDHSQLGAEMLERFCANFGLNTNLSHLACWLVENHLLMSITAQKQDISDPEIIRRFAEKVGSQAYLDHLLLLTIADINATNPKLWNAWRASLMRQLYFATSRALRRGLENPINKAELIAANQADALKKLETEGLTKVAIKKLWHTLGEDYFIYQTSEDIAWQTAGILQQPAINKPLVLVKPPAKNSPSGGTKIFIYLADQPHLFAVTSAVLSQLNLSVHHARFASSDLGFTLNNLVVLEENGQAPRSPARLKQIALSLTEALLKPEVFPKLVNKHTTRRLKFFNQPTQVIISNDAASKLTLVEVISPDRPGLLAKIGQVFMQFNLWLHTAKINTMGERVEDVFFITDQNGKPLAKEATCRALEAELIKALDA